MLFKRKILFFFFLFSATDLSLILVHYAWKLTVFTLV